MSPQLHWHEGLFLLPHHLQHLQHSLSAEIADVRRLGLPQAYGIWEAAISQDELANHRLRFEKLKVVMPSGEIISAYENADLPDLDLKPLFATGETSFDISLAVPLWQSKRANAFEIGSHIDPRVKFMYVPREETLFDENTGENPKAVVVRRLNARLITSAEDRSDVEVIPLIRVLRGAGENLGMPRIDFEFVAPCIFLESSNFLHKKVRDLVNHIEASSKELAVVLTRGGFSLETIRGVQFEQLLRFRTLRRAVARLVSTLEIGRVSPFTWHMELKSLYAELTALHPEIADCVAAHYDHDDLYRTFNDIDVRIRGILNSAAGASFLRVEFTAEEAFLSTRLNDEHLSRPIEYYLAIRSKEDPREIIRLVEDPDQFKFMPRSLANRAVRGMVLKEERIAPMQLPVQAGLTYFRCIRSESTRIWQQIEAEKSVVIRWPNMAASDLQ